MTLLQRLPTQTKQVATGWQALSTHWVVRIANIGTLVFVGVSIIALLMVWKNLPPQVPVWYSQPWGEEQLAHPGWLFLLPASSIAWYATNVIFSVYMTMEYRVFAQLLFLSSLIVSFLSFLTLMHILVLVT